MVSKVKKVTHSQCFMSRGLNDVPLSDVITSTTLCLTLIGTQSFSIYNKAYRGTYVLKVTVSPVHKAT